MPADDAPFTIERQMALTRAEFLRTLPAAVPAALAAAGKPAPGDAPFTVDGDRVVVGGGAARIEIRLEPGPGRRLGAMTLPGLRARFDFFGFAAPERERFMARFDRHYRRGGG